MGCRGCLEFLRRRGFGRGVTHNMDGVDAARESFFGYWRV